MLGRRASVLDTMAARNAGGHSSAQEATANCAGGGGELTSWS